MAKKLYWVDDDGIIVDEYKPKRQRSIQGEFIMVIQAAIDTLVANAGINGTEYRVLWFMLSRMDFEGRILISQAHVASMLNITPSMVSSAVNKLSSLGFIQKIIVNGVRGYEINPEFAQKGSKRAIKIAA